MNPLWIFGLLIAFVLMRRSGGSPGGDNPPTDQGIPGTWTQSRIVTGSGEDITNHFSSSVRQWAPQAAQAGTMFGVPPELVLSMIKHESAGDPNASGPVGERGLMQITDRAVQDAVSMTSLTWGDLVAGGPYENILAGTAFLSVQKTRWENRGAGSWYDAIRAYICGFQGSIDDPSCQAIEATDRLTDAALV